MILKTAKFGEVEVNEEFTFNFIEPILGYEKLSKFALVDHMPDSPFKWLQSMEDESIALPITVPSFFDIDYEFVLTENDAKKLDAKGAEDILTLNIVNIPNGQPEKATINLLGPIVININNKNAMQIVLVNSNYSVRHKLFNEDLKKFDIEEIKKEETETSEG